ncbi:MAG TPA: hypothetical protein DC054_21870 [Blastocatellia bacterium]|nr:hypothetical protein [Blastocatellia bacterium]
MKIELLQPEPELEFGDSCRCQDMRFGIGHYGTFDFQDSSGPRTIKLGIVGTAATIDALTEWLITCKLEIPGKRDSKQPRLYPPFPGFTQTQSFHASLSWDERDLIPISLSDEACTGSFNEVVEKVVNIYVSEIDSLLERSKLDVVLCAPSLEHLKIVTRTLEPISRDAAAIVTTSEEVQPAGVRPSENADSAAASDDDGNDPQKETVWYEFHDLLKAKSLHLRTPLQHILPATYDESRAAEQKKLKNRDQQDEATRAWNLLTAIYYKAQGIPWRMTRDDADLRTCYVGVSFFRTLDTNRIYASSAQVFNRRGEGIIVRGRLAYEDTNKQIHLDEPGAYHLIEKAIEAFKGEHHHYPARVVIHKTSSFSNEELDGFKKFLKEKGIEFFDMVYLRQSFIRLFRADTDPPLRGTLWQLDERHAILYTRGSVPFYEAYPGKYPPRSLYMDCENAQRSVRELARECLALTKMNWNNTRFDGQLPITLRAAKQVGLILKYLEDADTSKLSQSYRFYM